MELFLIILLNILHGTVNAHFSLTSPAPRARSFNPIPGNEKGISNPMFVCGGQDTKGTPQDFAVGNQQISMEANAANHCGDCFGYISYDIDTPAAQQKYFLITKSADYVKEGAALGASGGTIVVPAWLPSKQAIFRWQCFTLHQGPPEYYAYCADVTITGGAPADGPYPEGQTMVGHMPTTGYGNCQNINHEIGPIGNPLVESGPGTSNPGATPTAPPTQSEKQPDAPSPTAAPPTVKTFAPPQPNSPTPAPPSQDVCKNQMGEDANCQNLISQDKNLCDTFSSWMHVKCAKACNVCDSCKPDSNEFCEYWASMSPSQCVENPIYMRDNCGQSCGYCEQKLDNSSGNHLKVSILVWLVAAAMLV